MTVSAVHHGPADWMDQSSLSDSFEHVDDYLPLFDHTRNQTPIIPVSITQYGTFDYITSTCSSCPDAYGIHFTNSTECDTSKPNSVIIATFPRDMSAFHELLNGSAAQSSAFKTRSGTDSHVQGRSSSSAGRSRPPRQPCVTAGATKRTAPTRWRCLLVLPLKVGESIPPCETSPTSRFANLP